MRALGLLVWACGAGAALAEPAALPQTDLPRTAAESLRIAQVLAPPQDFSLPEPFEDLPGGRATVAAPGQTIGGRQMDVTLGEALFDKLWVAAPSTTRASDGLGPLYNARSCAACHEGAGRGRDASDMVLRLDAGDLGHQLQTLAVAGFSPEGRIVSHPVSTPLAGEVLTDPNYRPEPDPGGAVSARMAPGLAGMGLLAAIPQADILAHADPDDRDGDGISGRAAWVQGGLGRFGWKAASATLRAQAAQAFSVDMGLSTPDLPDPWGDCPTEACRMAPHGQEPGLRDGAEVSGQSLDLVTGYLASLGVPARRGLATPQVLRGKQVFYEAGCPACHVPKFVTARLEGAPPQSFQLIWPYSDLLLHDMGAGLADDRPEGAATGSEWRTPPLWGLGRAPGPFLHDGRALSLLQAVLWHGGEAEPARDRVVGLSKADRDALIAFLRSL